MKLESLKKQTTVALLVKIEKSAGEEKEAIIEVLKSRGQDVSKWETVKEETESNVTEKQPEPASADDKLAVMRKEVDSMIDMFIEQKRSGAYSEVMKALGGKFDSDIDELLANATEAQLKEALSFKGLLDQAKEPKADKKKTEPKVSKPKENKIPEDVNETQTIADGSSVTYTDRKGNSATGKVMRFYFDKQDKCCYYVIKPDAGGSVTCKRPKNVFLKEE